MIIIVKKIYYEENIYKFPSKHWSEKVKKGEVSKALLTHKKGDLKCKKLGVEKWCCNEMREEKDDSVRIFEGEFGDNTPGCYLKVPSYGDVDYTLIKYCPFCGEKIEIEEE